MLFSSSAARKGHRGERPQKQELSRRFLVKRQGGFDLGALWTRFYRGSLDFWSFFRFREEDVTSKGSGKRLVM